MVTRDTPWPDGTPCWVDLGTSDIPKAISFYSSQFGWDVQQGGPEVGGYSMAQLDGRNVAGIGPVMGPPGTPSAWSTYFAVQRRGRHRGQGQERRRPAPDGADGRHGRRADAGRGRHHRRRLRRLAGREPHGRAGRERAWRVHLERAHEPRLRGRQGVLRRGLRLRVRRHVEPTASATPRCSSTASRSSAASAPTRAAARTRTRRSGGSTSAPPTPTRPSTWPPATAARSSAPRTDSPYGRMAIVADNQGAVFSLISTPADSLDDDD